MSGPSALVTLLLAGPPLAAPPVDVERVLALITDGDPAQTPDVPPTPVSDLVEAAEIAAEGLRTASPRYLSELLGYVDTARSLAFQRTNDLSHVRARLAVVESLLERGDLPANVLRRATKIRDDDRRLLEDHERVAPVAPEPAAVRPPAAAAAPPVTAPPSAPVDAPPPNRPAVIASGVLLGVAGLSVAGIVGVRAHDTRVAAELWALWADIDGADGKTEAQHAEAQRLHNERRTLAAVTASLGVVAGVTFLTGLGLGIWAAKQRRNSRVAVSGGPHGAGVTIHGRF